MTETEALPKCRAGFKLLFPVPVDAEVEVLSSWGGD